MAPRIQVKRLCKNCGERIPPGAVINGKRRDLSIRKYCLDCSPFNGRNSKQLEKIRGDGLKSCRDCSEDFPADSFPKKSARCRTCHNIHIRAVRAKFKARCVEYLGGTCSRCGYDRCLAAFDFHHPGSKDFEIGRSRGSFERIRPELDKCVLLCRNCHAEDHAGQEQFEWQEHLSNIPSQ